LRTSAKESSPKGGWSFLHGWNLLGSARSISKGPASRTTRKKIRKVAFFGHFDSSNFGNESTLQAMLFNFHRLQPHAQAICVTTGPAVAAATYGIEAVSIEKTLLHAWTPRHRLVRKLRRIFNGVLSEPHQWVRVARTLRHVDMLVIPGTGLLTDAYGLRSWGPYGLFRWSMSAKIYGCKLMFVSVGAGPLESVAGRSLARLILSLADYRSYRDSATMQYLKDIGVDVGKDQVCPDLAFSLPEVAAPRARDGAHRRTIVGLGVMHYTGRPGNAIEANYLQSLVQFAMWLIDRGYDVRLLSGDVGDTQTRTELREMLEQQAPTFGDGRIIDEPIASVSELLSQIAATDFVVATRFHNALLSLSGDKPTISISFHHKCASLMQAMGMSKYCLDIDALTAEALIESFSDLVANYAELFPAMRRKTQEFREELNHQYQVIFGEIQ
jgi:polysaccharide pyruvyl transferase WcaK-like protein